MPSEFIIHNIRFVDFNGRYIPVAAAECPILRPKVVYPTIGEGETFHPETACPSRRQDSAGIFRCYAYPYQLPCKMTPNQDLPHDPVTNLEDFPS